MASHYEYDMMPLMSDKLATFQFPLGYLKRIKNTPFKTNAMFDNV